MCVCISMALDIYILSFNLYKKPKGSTQFPILQRRKPGPRAEAGA